MENESNFTVVCHNILDVDGKTVTNPIYNLTPGKHYNVIHTMNCGSYDLYLIKDDLGLSIRHRSNQFMRLEEIRDKKLEELGIY